MGKKAQSRPAVSVLIPVYNVEKFLPQCLDSVCNQTLTDIEIICINDGSTDSSLDIIKQYRKKDKRIKLIDKENTGYGDSMNRGLEIATGEYIGIVEPDDWIELNGLDDLYKLAEGTNADIARANYYQNKKNKDEKLRHIPAYEALHSINPRQHVWIFLQTPAIWSAIYRREMIEKYNVRFLPTPGASYQDTGFFFKTMSVAKNLVLTTNAYLHYRTDNESSSVNNPGKVFCVVDEYRSIEEFLKENGLFDELGVVMWNAKGFCYFWNALRLDRSLQKEFLSKVVDEYVVAAGADLVFPDLFLEPIQTVTRLMTQGNVDAAAKVLQREKKVIRRHKQRQKILLKLRRTYAKQLEIEKLIDYLESQNEYLEQQIKLLKAGVKKTPWGKLATVAKPKEAGMKSEEKNV